MNAIQQISESVEKIEKCLLGDPMSNVPSLIAEVKCLKADVATIKADIEKIKNKPTLLKALKAVASVMGLIKPTL